MCDCNSQQCKKNVDEVGVAFIKCVSFFTDWTSVMMGNKTAVGKQIQSIYSLYCVQTDGVAYRLKLAFCSHSGKIKDNNIGICCFFGKYTSLRNKSKDWLAWNHDDNVFMWE